MVYIVQVVAFLVKLRDIYKNDVEISENFRFLHPPQKYLSVLIIKVHCQNTLNMPSIYVSERGYRYRGKSKQNSSWGLCPSIHN